jgi:hypothetical protein
LTLLTYPEIAYTVLTPCVVQAGPGHERDYAVSWGCSNLRFGIHHVTMPNVLFLYASTRVFWQMARQSDPEEPQKW